MSLTCREVELMLRVEMQGLSKSKLVKFAEEMGVEVDGFTRAEIEEACVEAELKAFTH